jgi:hypothetical protein
VKNLTGTRRKAPMRPRLSYANVASTLALILGLTGVAWAATLPRNSVGTGQLKRHAVRAPDIGRGAVISRAVRNRGLRAIDFARGQLPQGPQGLAGPPGAQGPAGSAVASGIVRVAPLGVTTGHGASTTVEKLGNGSFCLRVHGVSSTEHVLVATPHAPSALNVAGETITYIDIKDPVANCGPDAFYVDTFAFDAPDGLTFQDASFAFVVN